MFNVDPNQLLDWVFSEDFIAGVFFVALVAAAFFTRHLWDRGALYERAEASARVVTHDDLLTAIKEPAVLKAYQSDVKKVGLISNLSRQRLMT